ncbi:MAG: tyrosine--tRNA ligase [Deltaproteobacteria bacterium]|nr:tyrosine--tRNA ligase [Deltaproteobacteria bacterium]MBW1736716.1 tyrosine--tRNA ligase [Deltaproteobacteria bacterium]MBW1908612.1 tyrosine--tRNA ligase [Deltaproteobacteria bacterium]MBW2033020.1 tyrosine--tRNA ligase [Deltaproteobacteria bacterium]MBW2114557.1 tyrosine--tRNA ligase [Deltaproteobacteria bacterium]
MENVFDIFETRGFIEQVTDKESVRKLLKNPITCYIGFDPTAKSFHIGSLLPIMSLVHMQTAGHRPIAVIGGGTGLVGDPSGKMEMRPIMTREEIDINAEALKSQLSRFIDFSNENAIMVNNADWLTGLGYVDFLRDIGRHFSVNRMLAAESYRARLETGLNFIEFNYMLLQAYDFWYLFKHYDCRLQMGGNDQWGNILAGTDLIRRLDSVTAHGLTFPLLTTSSGIKMGKTHKGAVWLDTELTSPYDYYQYWINQDDRDVERFLALFTLLPLDEVRRLGALKGSDIRSAKEVLAYETTKLCHGQKEAEMAQKAARQLFGPDKSESSKSTPGYSVSREELAKGVPAYILFEKAGLCKTRGEARRLISHGGGYLNDLRVESFDQTINSSDLKNDSLLIRAGKKRYMRIIPG